jgi:hypothetical protein
MVVVGLTAVVALCGLLVDARLDRRLGDAARLATRDVISVGCGAVEAIVADATGYVPSIC